MIRKSIIIAFTGLILVLAVSLTNEGCKPYCASIPDESPASVRILNAVSNVDILLIYIDGKLFDRAYYDLNSYYNVGLNFGYRSTYISDGTDLRAGQHHIVAIASGGGIQADTVLQSDYILYNHRQSVICIGKLNGTVAQKPTSIYLNDVVRSLQTRSAARFIHAVPDLPGIDVYFDSLPKQPPDIRMHYGKISDNHGGDNGTGLSADDYFQFPSVVGGLIITPINDSLPGDFITNLPYKLPTSELLFTIVVRGETKPEGNEPTVETVALEDAQESPGTYSFEIQSFGVRLVNATRADSISLIIYRVGDPAPRTNYPSSGGSLGITPDSVGNYIPLNPALTPTYQFWFATAYSPNQDTIFSFSRTDTANERSTFIAIDTKRNDSGVSGIDSMILNDNYSNTSDPTMGRIRFVNTTADYNPQFTFGGKNLNMKQREVDFVDGTAGQQYSINVSDGNGHTATIVLTPSYSTPQTVFFMPSDSGTIPYRVTTP